MIVLHELRAVADGGLELRVIETFHEATAPVLEQARGQQDDIGDGEALDFHGSEAEVGQVLAEGRTFLGMSQAQFNRRPQITLLREPIPAYTRIYGYPSQ